MLPTNPKAKDLVMHVEAYLSTVLQINAPMVNWPVEKSLPFYLQTRYSFWKTRLLGNECLLMVATGRARPTAQDLAKHMQKTGEKWAHDIVFVDETVSSLDRRRMIEHRIPFIIPGNQMYLPVLGIDLREHFRKLQPERLSLSPATQVYVLDAIYNPKDEPESPTIAAKRFGISKMTMTRAFDELEKANLGGLKMVGKERLLRFPVKGRHLWEAALPFLKSPVKKKVFLDGKSRKRQWLVSGINAFAEYSNLSPEEAGIFALDAEEFRRVVGSGVELTSRSPGPDWIEIESWAYPPGQFGKKGIADPLSVFLMFKDDQDERVQMSLAEMLKDMQW
jgi:DNA-binding MarR family transcriptional regulator